jgi:hypothetical protein
MNYNHFIESAIAQYIDTLGKCRMIKFQFNTQEVNLFLEIFHPIDVDLCPLEFIEIERTVAEEFIFHKKLVISQYLMENEMLIGIYCTNIDKYKFIGFIKLIPTSLPESPAIPEHMITTDSSLPIQYKKISELDDYRVAMNIINTIYKFASILFSRVKKNEKNFIIDKEFYKKNIFLFYGDMSDLKELEQNMIIDNKLVIPDERFISKIITGEYILPEIISDTKGSLLFDNVSDILFWQQRKKNRNMEIVSPLLNYQSIEPYFYRNEDVFPRVETELVLIQNSINKSKESALRISKMYKEKKVNYGYYYIGEMNLPHPYIVYSEMGEELENTCTQPDEKCIFIIKYNNDEYASILPIFPRN